MARSTTTTGANFIPEIWSDEVKVATENALLIKDRVKMFNHVGKAGDIIHVPDISNLTANDMSETGEVNAQAVTESETQITIDKWKEASFRINDLLKTQSAYDLRQQYTGKAGYAIGKRMEQDVMALGVDATIQGYDADATAASASGGTIDVNGILQAIEDLDGSDVPSDNRYLFVNPGARNDMLKINQFTSVDYVNKKATIDAKIGEIFGLEVFVSNLLPTDGNSKTNALVFNSEAFALAMQQNPRVQAQYELKNLSWLVVTDSVYGVKLFRSDHVIRLVLA